MIPEEKFEKDVWLVLQQIKECQLYFPSKNGFTVFHYATKEWYDEKIIQYQILDRLEEWGVITKREEKSDESFCLFKIVQPKFNEIYEEYQKKHKKEISAIEMPELQIKENGEKLTEQKGKTREKTDEIYKIECVERISNTGKLKVVVNEDYSHPLEVNYRKYWQKMYQLADKKLIAKDKGFFDYFNSNSKNLFYSRLKYKPTKILKFDGVAIIVPAIKIELITEKKLAQRANSSA